MEDLEHHIPLSKEWPNNVALFSTLSSCGMSVDVEVNYLGSDCNVVRVRFFQGGSPSLSPKYYEYKTCQNFEVGDIAVLRTSTTKTVLVEGFTPAAGVNKTTIKNRPWMLGKVVKKLNNR